MAHPSLITVVHVIYPIFGFIWYWLSGSKKQWAKSILTVVVLVEGGLSVDSSTAKTAAMVPVACDSKESTYPAVLVSITYQTNPTAKIPRLSHRESFYAADRTPP